MSPDPLAVLARRFPGVTVWFGLATRSWWGMVWVSGGWRLVEATDADELTGAILHAATWPYPPAVGGGSETTRWDCPVVVTAK